MTSAGGTTTDVLKNIPSVNVDIDGNISIRNNTPQVFVDGRLLPLLLTRFRRTRLRQLKCNH